MAVVLAFVIGAVAALAGWRLMAPTFGADVFTRQNFRGRDLPTAVGAIIALVVLGGDGALTLADAAGAKPDIDLVNGLRLATFLAMGFAFLGLLDDLGGAGQSGGLRGHLSELTRGRLTTGAVKLFGGAALSVLVAESITDGSLPRVLTDGALIALAANLGNLFDRAPGRATKVALLAGLVLVVLVQADTRLAGMALGLGAAAGLLWPDLREELMLGDAGANVLGALVGVGVVLTCSPAVRVLVLVLVAGLNAASEVVSFSRVIDRVPPLRAVDQLGRQP